MNPNKVNNMLQGIQWPLFVTDEALNQLKNFECRDDDIWIATYPKAGTHWLVEMTNLILSNGDVDKIDRKQHPMPMEFEISQAQVAAVALISGVQAPPAPVPGYKVAPSWKSPRVLVTHVPKGFLPDQLMKQKKGKVIVVIRNPKDLIVSRYFFEQGMFPGMEKLEFGAYLQDTVFKDQVPYTSWFDHAQEYWAERHNKQVLILKYEDIKKDTRGAIVQIADHLGRVLSDDVIDRITDNVSIAKMRKIYHSAGEKIVFDKDGNLAKLGAPNLVRKGIVGDWKVTMTVAQNEAFDKLYKLKMAGSDLTVEFE